MKIPCEYLSLGSCLRVGLQERLDIDIGAMYVFVSLRERISSCQPPLENSI